MSVTLKKDLMPFLNLPRVGQPREVMSENDFEEVGSKYSRTAGDAGLTALNNAIAVVEDIGKGIASPFVGVATGAAAAFTGESIKLGPDADTHQLNVMGRVGMFFGASGLGILGAAVYTGQAVVDLSQSLLAAANGMRLLVFKK